MTTLDCTTPKTLPSQEYLLECFEYCQETGELRWKGRPREHFLTERGWKCFNSNDAWNIAGTKNSGGYLVVNVLGRRHMVHRIIWMIAYGRWPTNHIDHKNNRRTDNRLSNMREATDAENLRNCRIHIDNKTGFKGIHFHKARGKYHAQIMIDGIRLHLGYFKTPQAAHFAYCSASDKLHGDFANHGTTKP